MAYRVKVNLPNVPDDEEVEVLYLGLFKNGTTSSVDESVVRTWELQTGQQWPEGGTLAVDHKEAEEQRKEALADLPSEERKEVVSAMKQNEELVEDTKKKGGK